MISKRQEKSPDIGVAMSKELEEEEAQVIIVADKYIIEKKIGRGSFGEVYQGYDKNTKERVAIKLVR